MALRILVGGFATAILVMVSLATARASEDTKAFAAAYAPEQAFEACTGKDADTAIACARSACLAASKLHNQECIVLAACGNGGWRGVMSVALGEAHFPTATCGSPSRASVIEELKMRCEGYVPYQLRECSVWRLYSPQGEIEEPDMTWLPANLAEEKRSLLRDSRNDD